MIKVNNLSKSFRGKKALQSVNLGLDNGFSGCWGPTAPAKPPCCAVVYHRVLARDKQAFPSEEPSPEDGYMCLVRRLA